MSRLFFLVGPAVAAAITLAIVATPSPAAAHVLGLSINPTGTVTHPGGAQIGVRGTLRCTAGETGNLYANAAQLVRGQVVAFASGYSPSFTCSGVTQEWSLTLLSLVGFKPGRANVIVNLNTFGFDGFDFEEVAGTVRLRRGEPPPESPPESPPQSPPILGKIGASSGVVGGAALTGLLASGLTLGFLRVMNRRRGPDDIEV
jgi:hypothetical protein